MELSGAWRKSYTLRFVAITMVQVLFSAGTVFLLSAVHATSGARVAPQSLSHSLRQAELCVQDLSDVGQSWNCANHISGILGNLLRERLKPRIETQHLGQQGRGRCSKPNTHDRTSQEYHDKPKTSHVMHSMSSTNAVDSTSLPTTNPVSDP